MSNPQARIYILPLLRLTTVRNNAGERSLPIDHQLNGTRVKYWREVEPDKSAQPGTFRKFPFVLNADGSPWEPALLWLMERARAKPTKVSSLHSIAQALKDYKVFLDDHGFDWSDFSAIDKLLRPTYLYLTHLEELVSTGHIKPSTAKRRMSSVIGLYRFARHDRRLRFSPANEPWMEKTISLLYRDNRGVNRIREIVTTDLRVRAHSGEDALSEDINDGGSLRPMMMAEQEVLICALRTLGNTEFSLMHYIGLATGAREMTIMTLRVGEFLAAPAVIASWPFKLRCGPGTGIDTKFDKTDVHLMIPEALYRMLHVYALSERAEKRRAKSRLKNSSLNYLFLTRQGNPYYEGKDEYKALPDSSAILKRSSSQGQSLREFIRKRVMPEIQKTFPNFHYKFHDTRATFGMNWVDNVMENGDYKKYSWAIDQLRKLMWHKSIDTTEKYLNYRRDRQHIEAAQRGWAAHILGMIEPAAKWDSEDGANNG